MEPWDVGVYDNEEALELIDLLLEQQDPRLFLSALFDEVVRAETVDFADASSVLAAATLVAAVLNGSPCDTNDDEFSEWYETVAELDFSALRFPALTACQRTVDPSCGLYCYWSEKGAEFLTEWLEVVENVMDGLRDEAETI